MTWTLRIRARENMIRYRWPLRHESQTQRYMIREHVRRLRLERDTMRDSAG